jgi:hypothetical protein
MNDSDHTITPSCHRWLLQFVERKVFPENVLIFDIHHSGHTGEVNVAVIVQVTLLALFFTADVLSRAVRKMRIFSLLI